MDMSTQTSNCSMSRITCSTPSSEESGWSTYIDEFSASTEIIREESAATASTATDSCSSSISSDATSRCVTLKRKRMQGFNSSKAKAEAISDIIDDPLEDTATSFTNKKEKGTKSMELKREGRDDMGKECSELRKRGLCLVPVSMLLEYLG